MEKLPVIRLRKEDRRSRGVWAEGVIYPVLTAMPFGLCLADIFTRKLRKKKIKDNPYNYIENNFINITDNRDVFLFPSAHVLHNLVIAILTMMMTKNCEGCA